MTSTPLSARLVREFSVERRLLAGESPQSLADEHDLTLAAIDRIWRRSIVGSNVVDTVIRTLRRKLGSQSNRVQTVPKAGYRYVSPADVHRG